MNAISQRERKSEIINGREIINVPPRIQPPDLKEAITIHNPPEPRFKRGRLSWAVTTVPLGIMVATLVVSVLVSVLGSTGLIYLLIIGVGTCGALISGGT